jgi:hypothetical protein
MRRSQGRREEIEDVRSTSIGTRAKP